ncbi:SDR family oxidoreductase [Lactiplantibacillus mudanjiangensis]|uniref:Short-chain dehydrogenase/oxidoreductase [Lactobacillus plantarum JDM1] n=1 Tax=Lactiplantibacillus mudanjiangensis TaxID=1296538 RepID=A0A660DVK1_9LACO|nr:SDR family oxidoreductase [Lactiplantibacillus mudanjiangensis]VDG20049.1 short-chain dehydrogenase/oxidoreductase [Lactobacillus plantarum JDM1] [Lactiplantibacillus mudanjiangensis]VDG26208.1 short-chain dehydrogenase/oxidoreductase [Lactobacillus plantarum JDM1] [Lactiplantibacillus mudanjiangensis]VDG27364.1 short-chain dehydrogenase/oxidoreductase [Lactobacillus plantarum JDM1] [Lactiplantibacillus mudanjiangensis]VDG33447.1 short-chain dehydrogenase/oxidoreductase [Lactobacillus planta
MTVKNKVIVITGASSGIGEASAKLLAKNGAKVVLGARRTERLAAIVKDIEAAGGEAAYQVTDVTKQADVDNLVKFAQTTFGGLDVIFNNAGIMPSSPISALHTDEWDAMIDINLKGVLHGVAAVMPIFTAQKHGQIITTSSVAGIKSFAGAGVYGATKFAVRNLMEVIRMESAQEGTNIRTASLYPAAINTELLHTITDELTKQGMDAFYQQVGISPAAVANVVNFAVDQPEDVNVNEFTIYPTKQA